MSLGTITIVSVSDSFVAKNNCPLLNSATTRRMCTIQIWLRRTGKLQYCREFALRVPADQISTWWVSIHCSSGVGRNLKMTGKFSL